MPSILSPPPYLLVVVLLTACLDVSRVAAYFDCGDASPSPPASSPLPAPTTNDGGSSSDAAFRANLLTLLPCLVPRLPCCSGNQGGVVLGYNCFLRIQVYTFYDLALDAPPPADEPPAAAAVPSPTHAGEASGEFECDC
jgi:hypothetical protein